VSPKDGFIMLRNLTLELSLKPFKDKTESGIQKVCSTIFDQWAPLIRHSDMVSIMLWASDGSEILEYKGDLKQKFEWCYWLGVANNQQKPNTDSKRCTIHNSPEKYIKNPPEFDYEWLMTMIKILKETGKKLTGKKIRVGATFDSGPEFAISEFKYKKHPEICQGGTMGKKSFVTCNTRLHADNEKYAGFQNGIPEGTEFGVFLGRQCKHFLQDMGYDYIWFSNGFGFGLEAWGYKGSLFDGGKFMPEKASATSKEILDFWRYFKEECPDFPIETRGSNMSAGIEIATDACPVKEIYDNFKPAPPINSPWAPLNGDFGLEMTGWMSHIAEIPEDDFAFRFYTHDPWFLNSPWLDRYERQPHDIYMPLSVSRIKEDGTVQTASGINFLTIDDSYGNMPEQVPNEVTPHILEALNHCPDAPGPLVFIYPFDEYNEFLKTAPEKISGIFADEWFIRGAFNHGFPLNTVISTGNLKKNLADNPDSLKDSVLSVPVSALEGVILDIVIKFVNNGGKILIYGSLSKANPKLLKILGIKNQNGLSGELKLNLNINTQIKYPEKINHSNLLSDGPLTETTKGDNVKIIASASNKEGKERILATSINKGKGKIVWVRTCNSCKDGEPGHIPPHYSPEAYFHPENLMRMSLKEFGIEIDFKPKKLSQATPVMTISRHKNAFYFSGCNPNTNMNEEFKLPYGAPVFTGTDTEIIDGKTSYSLPRSWRHECRIFIKQAERSELTVKELHAAHPTAHKRLFLKGLKDAEIIFFPETGYKDNTFIINDENALNYISYPINQGDINITSEQTNSSNDTYLKYSNITGNILISW
jgi:hypothetical protein